MSTLENFIAESNRIEGIHRDVLTSEIEAHEKLLASTILTVSIIEDFVNVVAHRPLRRERNMNVFVGRHIPPTGGPHVEEALERLLKRVSLGMGQTSAWQHHVEYETLHPFMDGNGRSGRAIWLWEMGGIGKVPLGFLHHFYYQTLAQRS